MVWVLHVIIMVEHQFLCNVCVYLYLILNTFVYMFMCTCTTMSVVSCVAIPKTTKRHKLSWQFKSGFQVLVRAALTFGHKILSHKYAKVLYNQNPFVGTPCTMEGLTYHKTRE